MRLFILAGSTVYVASEREVSVGSAGDETVVLRKAGITPGHLRFHSDGAGRWTVSNAGPAIRVNNTVLDSGQSIRLSIPAQLAVGEEKLELRNASEPRKLRQTLAQWMHDVETRLHIDSVDAVRRLEPGKDDQVEMARIRDAVATEAVRLTLPPAFEAYLASMAVTELLVNRVNGVRETDSDGVASQGSTQILLDQISATIRLQEDVSTAERVERIHVLVPWAMRMLAGPIPVVHLRQLARHVLNDHLSSLVYGLGPIDALLQLPDVNDVMVLPNGSIFIERAGVMQDSGRRMLSPAVSHRVVERIVGREGRRIDLSQPLVDSRTTRGDRLNAVISPLSVDGPTLTIRRAPENRITFADMVARGALTVAAAEFLRASVAAKCSLVISGGTGSGKTTLLRELAMCVPDTERIVTIEDTAELMLNHPHVVPLQARPANLEGANAVTIRDLVRNSLRMRPDRVIVGECRGGETLDMLQAMNTGHEGSMTTIHANSPIAALLRLETMSLQAEHIDLPSRVVREQIVSAVNLIVQIERVAHRYRRVTSICEVVGLDEDGSILIEEIYGYRHRRVGGGIRTSRLTFTGYVPSFFDTLAAAGASVRCLR